MLISSFPNRIPKDRVSDLNSLILKTTLTFLRSNYHEVEDGWEMRLRKLHDDFLFIPCLGKIEARIGSDVKIIGPGELMFVPEGIQHSARLVDSTQPFHVMAIHFHLQDQVGGLFARRFSNCFLPFSPFKFWSHIFKNMIALQNSNANLAQEYANQYIKSFLSECISRGTRLKPDLRQQNSRIITAIERIYEDLTSDLSIETLAGVCGLSTVQFRKLFKNSMGMSPKKYIAGYRLKTAAKALRCSQASVKKIAYDVGFEEERYFHLCFKKSYGMTPGQYREQGLTQM